MNQAVYKEIKSRDISKNAESSDISHVTETLETLIQNLP